MENRLKTAYRLFDEANQNDPHSEISQGREYPKELLYALRMSEKVEQFAPEASEAVRLAARCQHICRWEIPRENYEMNRAGYLRWRKDLALFHSEKAAELLARAGYQADEIEQVTFLLQKKQLKKNSDTQLLEDVICLVFLEHHFEPFSKKYSEEKMTEILRKTWGKMSEKGQEAALKIQFAPEPKELIMKALS